MKTIISEEMRELDRRVIKDFNVPGFVLMDRAGKGVASIVRYLAEISFSRNDHVVLIAGKGNNGGDAFVAARYLFEWGFEVDVLLAARQCDVRGDAGKHLKKMLATGVALRELKKESDWQLEMTRSICAGGFAVDALLGTGIRGSANGVIALAIKYINMLAQYKVVVSVDVPSGLNSDTGASEGETVRSDLTATMGLPKKGLLEPVAIDYTGSIEVVDIGIPDALVNELRSSLSLLTAEDIQDLIKPRRRNSHKGDFGRILVIAGASSFSGAAVLAARAAMRSGVGLVTLITPECVAPIIAGQIPEVMVHGASETSTGSLSANCLDEFSPTLDEFDSVLIGPGITEHDQSRVLVEKVLKNCSSPLVMDADALNVCEHNIELISDATIPIIITPHPGEMGRLAGCSASDVQRNRQSIASRMAKKLNVTVVLKGAGSIIANKDHNLTVNMTGNPGMSSAGMGDVLAGIIAGIAAQGISPYDAARIGVYLHGRAGDNVAWQHSQNGIIASDVIEEIPNVFREIVGR